MNLSDALKYGVLADFHSGDKRDQFAGLLHTAATDPQLGIGLLADFTEDHNHPLAPVFRRLQQGEGRTAPYEQHSHELIDHSEEGPTIPLTDKTKRRSLSDPASYLTLHHHYSEGPVWRFTSHLGWKGGEWPVGHSVILPAHPKEIEAFQKALAAEPTQQQEASRVAEFQARSANMQQYKTLAKALKYVQSKPEDMLHNLHSGQHTHDHLVWADLLDDHMQPELAGRVRREVEGSAEHRPEPDDNASAADRVQWRLHTQHPSPAIRALADGGESEVNRDYLVRALRLSPNHHDQDAAVFLSPMEVPHQHHPARTVFKTLSHRNFREAGLVPKLVGDTLYLTDWEFNPAEGGFEAPQIRYHSSVHDKDDLLKMVEYAEQQRQQREEQGL